jgi:hypothetical protein
MNIEHNGFIGLYRDVYPQGYCQHLIDEFNRLEEGGIGTNRQKGEGALKHFKDDYQVFINLKNHNLMNFEGKNSCDLFFDGLQNCYNEYSNKYSVLRDNGNIRATAMKMQRTGPGGGYHIWHAEQGPNEQANRVVTYMLYLNSLPKEDGAETEFLYQQLRVSPEENTMVIWPAAYTHAHRGNPVLSTAHKYIVTGWFYYD